jgi:glycosyltransferase involved in cell wall biosynthesis
MTRLLGVHIAHGFSSETRVFASLLAERDSRYESCVLMHEDDGEHGDIDRFVAIAQTDVATIDTGWRPNRTGHRFSAGRARIALTYLRRIDSSIAVGGKFDPDVVYSSQQHYDCRTATRMASALGVPQIIHLHYIIGPWLRRTVVERLRTANHVVAVSDYIRDQAIDHGVAPDRVTTIRNTVPRFEAPDAAAVEAVRRAQGIPADAFVYGMVGRLDPSKGHMDAIAAFDRVAAADHGVWLVIAGTGRHESRIRSAARRAVAANRIAFLGQRSDVPDILAAMDAFVHPATADPCPLAVLEAMAAGLPIIAYADGGVPELIEGGSSGFLAPLGDIKDLGGLMGLVRRDPDTARKFAAAAAARVASDFTPEHAGAAFAEVVTAVAATAKR